MPNQISTYCGSKTHAVKAIKWLKRRSLLSYYDRDLKQLVAYEFKQGPRWTFDALSQALRETE